MDVQQDVIIQLLSNSPLSETQHLEWNKSLRKNIILQILQILPYFFYSLLHMLQNIIVSQKRNVPPTSHNKVSIVWGGGGGFWSQTSLPALIWVFNTQIIGFRLMWDERSLRLSTGNWCVDFCYYLTCVDLSVVCPLCHSVALECELKAD